MPRTTRLFDPTLGPIITVSVTTPLGYLGDEEMPRSEKLEMLIDTGASDSFISGAAADRLGLPPLGLHDITGFGSNKATFQYLADITMELDTGHSISDHRLFRFESEYEKIQGIVGRDILAMATFEYEGPQTTYTLEF